MSCIFFNPFTFKRCFKLFFLGLVVFSFNCDLAAAKNMEITGHYYVANDAQFTKYTDKIQWKVTSIPEWSKFLVSLKTMPKDLEKNNPMGLKQPEVIHFNVVNSDQKTGHDLFISKAGIQQFSKMPVDTYFDGATEFREFLETELSFNPGYDKVEGEIDINQPGIVVVFRGSDTLKNPYWTILPSDKKVIERYKYFFKNLQKSPYTTPDFLSLRDEILDTVNTFVIYLNYKDAPFSFIIVGPDGTTRGTKIASQYFYYKDMAGYFSMFKRQAEDNLKAASRPKEEPEETRKRAVKNNELF